MQLPFADTYKKEKNKGLESSWSGVKEGSKAINQCKMIGEGFYLQASVEFIRTCLRRKVTQYDSRGGALTCSNTQADAQFSSKLHVLHPGNCLRRNCIVKKKSHSAYWWLLYFITMLNELGPRLTVQMKMPLEDICSCRQLKPDNKDHGVSATSVSRQVIFPSEELFQYPDTCVVSSLCLLLQ